VSLRLRFSITFALVVAVVVGTLGAVLYLTMQQTLSAEMDRRLQVRSDEVQLAVWPGPESPTLADFAPGKIDLSPLADISAANVYVQVLDLSGRALALSDNLQSEELPVDRAKLGLALRSQSSYTDTVRPSGRSVRVLTVPLSVRGSVAGVLQVGQIRDVFNETMADLRRLLIIIGSAAALVAGGVGWVLSYRGLRPLSAISSQAAEIAVERQFGRRLELGRRRRDEIGKLANTIDELLGKVDETLQAHREFVADTSHELRNPLLAIQTNLELLTRFPEGEDRDECVSEATQQVERMSRLVSDLLLLAQVERGLVLERRTVDLADVAARAVQDTRRQAAGRKLTLEGADSAEMLGDEGRIAQIMDNLLDNAIKHTPAGGAICVAVEDDGDEVRVRVADNGEGIAPEHLSRIFERAFQVSPGRQGGAGGYGLGLPIVKYLTEAQGGQVCVASELGRGSSFTVSFPAQAGGGSLSAASSSAA
jgi:signal transduction histidine kinase